MQPRLKMHALLLIATLDACASKAEDETSSIAHGDESTTGPFVPPEPCETRQQEPDGSLAGPTDIQATCDPTNSYAVALHRPSTQTCTTDPAPLEACADPGGECMIDADCASLGPGGRCSSFDGVGGLCRCVLPCVTDEDCAEDRACLCRAAVFVDDDADNVVSHTECVPAECRRDADCGPEGECSMPSPNACGTRPMLRCRGDADACQSDLDCTEGQCIPANDGWKCEFGSCQ